MPTGNGMPEKKSAGIDHPGALILCPSAGGDGVHDAAHGDALQLLQGDDLVKDLALVADGDTVVRLDAAASGAGTSSTSSRPQIRFRQGLFKRSLQALAAIRRT